MIGWPADDARLPAMADRLAALFDAIPVKDWEQDALPADLAALLDAVFLDSVPCAARLLTLLQARGSWAGPTSSRCGGRSESGARGSLDQLQQPPGARVLRGMPAGLLDDNS